MSMYASVRNIYKGLIKAYFIATKVLKNAEFSNKACFT